MTKQKFHWLVNVSGHLPKIYFEPCKIKNLFQTKDQDMFFDCAALKEATVDTAGFILNSQLLDTFNKIISQSQLQ